MKELTIIERAFAIARAGKCKSVQDLIKVLKAERFEAVELHLSGRLIRRELRCIIIETVGAPEPRRNRKRARDMTDVPDNG